MQRIPEWLAPSARTDLSWLLSNRRSVVRLHVGRQQLALRRWARRHGLFASADADGYVAISREAIHARRVIDLDRRPGRHTHALGLLLGYPRCCSRSIDRFGDEGIDARHAVLSGRRFHGQFRAIDPTGYLAGQAYISHVPCSHRCSFSLAQVQGLAC